MILNYKNCKQQMACHTLWGNSVIFVMVPQLSHYLLFRRINNHLAIYFTYQMHELANGSKRSQMYCKAPENNYD